MLLDVTDENSVLKAAEQVGGRLDGLVDSAGLITQGHGVRDRAVLPALKIAPSTFS